MSQYSVSEPDCSDEKSLIRRSDTFVARTAGYDGIIDADPVPAQEEARDRQAGNFAAHEGAAYQAHPPRMPPRERRIANVEVEIAPQPQPRDHVSQQPISQQPPQEHQPQGLLIQLLRAILGGEPESSPAAAPDTELAQTTRPRLINIALMQDEFGWHLHLFISRGARPMLLGLITAIVLIVMGKLSDAIEIIARLLY